MTHDEQLTILYRAGSEALMRIGCGACDLGESQLSQRLAKEFRSALDTFQGFPQIPEHYEFGAPRGFPKVPSVSQRSPGIFKGILSCYDDKKLG